MDYTKDVHILQKAIIDQLRKYDTQRYSELHPKHIESSHFKYHLSELLKQGVVEQRERGIYALSTKGISFADRLSEHRINPHAMPKLITYTLLFDDVYYYLFKKANEPYRNLLNLIGGKIHVGETPMQASIRELQEKASLTNISPKLLGVTDIQIMSSGSLLTHATAYIFSACLVTQPNNLTAIPKSSLQAQDGLAPDTKEIIRIIESSDSPFIHELQFNL